MFISKAYAAVNAATNGASDQGSFGSGLISMVPMVIIFGIFYFFVIRPQNKKREEHQELLKTLEVGNQIITMSGIYGTITDVDNVQYIIVNISDNKIPVKMLRDSISQVLNTEKEVADVKNKKNS